MEPEEQGQPVDQQEQNMLAPKPEDFLKEAAFDKFRGEDGNIDQVKMAKSYRELEKKMGRGADDMPPESVDGYELPTDLPPGMDAESLGMKQLADKLHKAGAGKKVAKLVMDEYKTLISRGMEMQAQAGEQKSKQAEEVLKQAWGADFDKELVRAQKAFQAVADDSDRAAMADLASSPAVMKLLAKLGRNLEEDSPVHTGSSLPSEDLNALMKSQAYWDGKHPDHDKVKARVKQHFDAKHRK
jgi:hypothetical protein